MRSLFVFALCMSGVLPATADPASSTSESKGTALDAPAVESKSSVDGEQEDRTNWESLFLKGLNKVRPDKFKLRSRLAIADTYLQLEKPDKIKVSARRERADHKIYLVDQLQRANLYDLIAIANVHARSKKGVPRQIKAKLKEEEKLFIKPRFSCPASASVPFNKNAPHQRLRAHSTRCRKDTRCSKTHGIQNMAFMIQRAKKSRTLKEVGMIMEASLFRFLVTEEISFSVLKGKFNDLRSALGDADVAEKFVARYKRLYGDIVG
uniref:RxLR effector candidate protein n=1 Tax=Hyaloperonospora arabidopsidis (strain Emoy2) TaxID=559515 RepID=M4BQ74_HYAAE